MPVPSTMVDISATAASNSPAGSDSIGTSADDFIRAIQAIMKQQFSAGTTLASGTTITPLADGNYITVTGVTTITTIASTNSWNGRWIALKFSGVLQLTHSALLILPGAANYTTTANDVLEFVQESSGVWRCTSIAINSVNATTATVANGLKSATTTVEVNAATAPTSGQVLTATSSTAATWQTISVIPPGAVAHFAMSSAPDGWLKANGAAISRTTYAALFTAIGTVFGVGDGSTTFNLPDLRGEFLRCLDDGRGVDIGRALGSAQADEIESHSHSLQSGDGYTGSNEVYERALTAGAVTQTGLTGGAETRPRNVALLACIKY